MSNENVEIVEQFFERSGRSLQEGLDAFDEFFTAETVWENVGVSLSTGPEEAKKIVENFPFRYETMTVDMKFIVAKGPIVFTERVDYFHSAAGETVMTVRVCGIFEIESGRILRWRDYFPTA
ncbi:limonene-1,2-epoxide hydrolase family protein [Pseudomonas sp. SB113]|uniref:limonene-1,2-epoxide hydrolase family protein n=1 Tax=Pseudomonas sp. SB113 TaxID=3154123 RepID=UPI00345D74C0